MKEKLQIMEIVLEVLEKLPPPHDIEYEFKITKFKWEVQNELSRLSKKKSPKSTQKKEDK